MDTIETTTAEISLLTDDQLRAFQARAHKFEGLALRASLVIREDLRGVARASARSWRDMIEAVDAALAGNELARRTVSYFSSGVDTAESRMASGADGADGSTAWPPWPAAPAGGVN
jgi:hypothetical protein